MQRLISDFMTEYNRMVDVAITLCMTHEAQQQHMMVITLQKKYIHTLDTRLTRIVFEYYNLHVLSCL